MTTQNLFNLNVVDASWRPCIKEALDNLNPAYLEQLRTCHRWLPGPEKIFNAFSLPVNQIKYVLFGESPYPRACSANGYAFWDAAVTKLWSPTGLSKEVNRATSLRNIIKMLLVAENFLEPDNTNQGKIAELNKKGLIETNSELFSSFINHGFLLLNASLVLQDTPVHKDAAAWHPFIKHILDYLFKQSPSVELLLFGNIAHTIDKLVDHFEIKRFYAEHPYNLSFIQNSAVIQFFKPLHLLLK